MDGQRRFFGIKLYDSTNNMKQVLRKVGRSTECGASKQARKQVTFTLCIPLKNNSMTILAKLLIII